MTRKIALAVVLLATTAGCNFWYNEVPSPDDLMHAVPWFDHMIRSPAPHPYERADIPRNTPAGIVPVSGGPRDWGNENYSGAIPIYGFDTTAANNYTRPAGMVELPLAHGKELFETYCSVCHGSTGTGGGTVPKLAPAINPPTLVSDRVQGFADGYLYSIIRYGRGLMPRYGDKIVREDERWAVVDYIRSLQTGSNQ